ncbi:hypothetical protein [Brevibacillus marinus]|uniref:hypothetical protein n=1 Tax=Brevibacillus marinus TaxID=2496837 RepID=UPI000F8339DF|nr:hypothetical protein [Brevibacillus marinus]
MPLFDGSDLEKIHLALDMAQRYVRGEQYHGDQPQVLLQDFEQMKKRVQERRRELTQMVEQAHRLTAARPEDADFANQNPPL